MNTTPASLLERLRQPTGTDWDQFVLLYSPLLYLWAGRLGVTGVDADDLVQDIFTTLVEALPQFRYDKTQRFRGWLWVITRNAARQRARRKTLPTEVLLDVPDPTDDPATEADDREYRATITRRAMELMQADFEPAAWQSFWATVVEGRAATDIAVDLEITPNAVYLAKARVLRRLRSELAGLLD